MQNIIPAKINLILSMLHNENKEAYLVGGCVRDMILNRSIHDYDITTSAFPQETISILQKNYIKAIPTGIKHGTITAIINNESIEITTYRIEKEYLNHRHPSQVIFTNNLKEDLKRRDFTMNAIAFDPVNGIYDPFHGKDDIENKIIRCVGDASERFNEDALRILRAVRFQCQLHFSLDDNCKKAIIDSAFLLKYVSKERIRDEFNKILLSNQPNILKLLKELNILDSILPSYSIIYNQKQNTPWHIYDIFTHTDIALNHSKNYPLESKLAVLLHDIGKPKCKTTDKNGQDHFKNHAVVSEQLALHILQDLKYDNKTIKKVCTLIRYHDYYIENNRSFLRRYITFFQYDINYALQAIDIQLADNYAKNPIMINQKIDEIIQAKKHLLQMKLENDIITPKDLNINGNDLKQLGFKGKEIHNILERCFAIVLNNPTYNTKNYLLAYIKKNIN